VVVALVVGFVAMRSSDSSRGGGPASGPAEPDWAAFEEAVADLAEAKGVRYAETATFGSEFRDITVTDTGWSFGQRGFPEGGLADLGRDLLWVGGKAYSRSSVATDAELEQMGTAAEGEGTRPGAWTFDALGESDELEAMFGRMPRPADLAADLGASLDELRRQPDAADHVSATTVDELPVLQADTSAGRLIVTEDEPHQVLRLEPYDDADQLDRWHGRATQEDDDGPWDHLDEIFGDASPSGKVTTGPLADSDSAGIDLLAVPPEEAEWMFDALEDYITPLDKAIDGGITLSLASNGAVSCSAGGCMVTENFTGSVATRAQQRLTGGQVDATMTATITIDGQPAGRCITRQVVPITSATVSGTLSCSSPEAGSVFVATDNRYRAQAQARSRASGGRPVPYSFPYASQTLIQANAVATVEVKQLLDQNRRNRGSLPCTTGRGTPPRAQGLVGPARRSPPQPRPPRSGRCDLEMPSPGSRQQLPYDMRLARAAAQELGLDVNGVWFRHDAGNHLRWEGQRRGATVFGETIPGRVVDQIEGHPVYFQGIVLTRNAFRDERTLRTTLLHEFQHVDDLRTGRPPRNTDAHEAAIEAEARRRYDEWAANHP